MLVGQVDIFPVLSNISPFLWELIQRSASLRLQLTTNERHGDLALNDWWNFMSEKVDSPNIII